MPSIIDNPELYEKAKRIVYQEYPKHSAYRSGQLVKRYKEMGGTYSGTKPKGGLTSWFKENWKSIGGDYPTYRPTIRVNKDTPLTASEIDPVQAKKQIALKQKIKGEANLPPFEKKGKGNKPDKKLRPLFNRMGSKYSMIDEILPLIPPHTIYVEPFVGSGSIFWNKVPAEKSVINDLDKEIIDGYSGFKKASLSSLQKLDKFDNTVISRTEYKTEPYRNMIHKLEADMEAIKSKPVRQFIQTFKRSKGTFSAKLIGGLYFNYPIGRYIPKLELYKRLIKDTVIENKSYVDIIKKYDGPETFFFLDPPYENSKGMYVDDTINYEQMRDILRNIKGKFLLTLNDSTRVRDIFKEFHITKSMVKAGEKRSGRLWAGGRNEIYISNYKVKTGGMMPPPPDSPTRGMIISPPPQIISREQMRANVERSRNMFREALAPTGYFAPIDPAGLSSFNQPQIVRPTPVRPTPIRQIQYPITGEDIETANTMLELSKTGRGGGAPMGVDVVDYKIDPEAKKVAKKLGVKIEPSKKKFKKIDVFDLNNQYITSVGDSRYNDYRSYIKEKGKEYADTRRRLYKIRHQRNRLVEGSPSYYADQLLW